MKIEPEILKKNPIKSVWKLGLNENKWTEYSKNLMKEFLLENA